MSEIELDIPNIVVLVNNDPDYRKVIVKPDSNFNVNINVPRITSRVSGSFIQFAETALTASYALNAAGAGFPYTGNAVITGSLLVVPTGSTGGITGSLLGTASIAENITVIFAGTYETGSDSPIVPTPSGGLIYVKFADFATTASYALNSAGGGGGGGSGAGFPYSGSGVITGSLLISSSGLILVGRGLTGSVFGTSSWAENATSSSYATSASFSNTSNFAATASYALNIPANIVTSSAQINSGSFTGSFVGVFTGNLTGTASSVTYENVTNKPTLISASSQVIASDVAGIGAYATTASNNFTGIQTITDATNSTLFTNGALVVQGGVGIAKDVNISGSLRVLGVLTVATMSTTYVTSSQYNVGVSRILLNDDDLVRFAGISVVDSGSTYGTGSILWDSFRNHWVYQADDQNYNSAIIIAGPKNTGSLGDEAGLVIGRVPIGTGEDHIDNRVESSSIRIDFPSRLTHIEAGLQVTGSVTASGGFLGTSSQAISSSYALTASYALNGGSGGTSAGFPYSGSAIITGSLLISGSGLRVTGSTDIVGNFTATTKSFLINHQRLEGKKLVYGVLEGPEHAVFVRGKLKGSSIITLPEEWEWLVDESTITVHLTPIKSNQKLYVNEVTSKYIVIGNDQLFAKPIHCYYIVHAERKDVPSLETII